MNQNGGRKSFGQKVDEVAEFLDNNDSNKDF